MIAVRTENEGGVVQDISCISAPAESACGCNLERSRINGCASSIGIIPGERERACAVFRQASGGVARGDNPFDIHVCRGVDIENSSSSPKANST